MLVKTLLKRKDREIITIAPGDSIDRAMELLIENKIGCLPVLEDQKLVGIVSDKDIFKKVHETRGAYHDLAVKEVMSTKLVVGMPDDEISYIATVMDQNWIRHVPIVQDDALVGLISQRDITRTLREATEVENRYLRLYTDGLAVRDKSADF